MSAQTHIDVEACAVGALLYEAGQLPQVRDVLAPDDFEQQEPRLVYEAILATEAAGVPVDAVTVVEELDRRRTLEVVGGVPYLAMAADSVPDPLHARAYALMVARAGRSRRMRAAPQQAMELVHAAYDEDLPDALAQAQDVLRDALAGREAGAVRPLDDLLHEALDAFDAAMQGPGTAGLSTGLLDLDRVTGGLRRGDLTVLAARPAMGKSALALCILRAALKAGKAALLFSLEMDGEQVSERLICMEASIDLAAARSGRISRDNYGGLLDAASALSGGRVFVDEAAVIRTQEMTARARDIKRDAGGLDLVVVDYLQLVDGSEKNNNRVQEVDKVARDLKALARDLDVPVLALAQLSRAVDSRPDHKPLLSDLREAGGIEANADNVLFLVREYVYSPEHADEHAADLIVAKQRNGPTGAMTLRWEPRFTRFDNAVRSVGAGATAPGEGL